MKAYLDSFFSMGVYAYFVIGFFILAFIFMIISLIYNKNARAKWLAAHPGAVKVALETGTNLITQKDLYARVISGEGKAFVEKGHYIILAMPGQLVLEVRYSYTRPGVLHKNVTTTWGPSRIELQLESGKNYALSFDRKEEQFKLQEK